MPKTRMLLVRHGQTPWNADGRWQGHGDPGLTAEGRAQADQLARAPHEEAERRRWNRVIASGLARAQQTARAVADLLSRTRSGVAFDRAFTASFNATPEGALTAFWYRSALWYRWLPFLTSSTVLWIAVTLLALMAIKRRRERDQMIHATWEAEEKLLDVDVHDTVH